VSAKKFLTPLDMTQLEIQNAVVQLLGSDPGSPVNGQIWVNSTSWVLKARLNGATVQWGRLDQITAPTASVNFNSQKITSLADGTASTDAATVGQLTAIKSGMDWKDSVRVATTANGTLATAFANGQTVDGVTLVTGDRILLKNQSTGADNGIYTVAASGAPTRATDADISAEVTAGMTIPVEEGTSNADTIWILTTNNAITLGTTALTFSKVPVGAGSSIVKFTATGPSGAGTTWAVTHNLGTSDAVYTLRDASTNAEVMADAVFTDGNTLTFSFGASQSINALKVTVMG
jgi:phage-related tail fiber protein